MRRSTLLALTAAVALLFSSARASAEIVRVDFAGVMDFSEIGGSASEPYAGVFLYDTAVPPFNSGVVNGMTYAHYQLTLVSFQIFGRSTPPSHVSILVQDAILPSTCNDFFTLTLLFSPTGVPIPGTTRRVDALGVNATACPATMFSSSAFPTNVNIRQAATSMNDYAQLESGRLLTTQVPPAISNVVFTAQSPGAPASFQASVSGNIVSMSWGVPSVGGAPSGYAVVARSVSGQFLATVPVGLVNTVSVPAPNGVYLLSVRAFNGWGSGPESNSVTATVPQVIALPGAPTSLVVNVSGTTAQFSWLAPSTGGPVTNYRLVAGTTPNFSSPMATLTLPATPGVSVPGIPPGTYYVRVLATNAAGTSAPSNEVMVVVSGSGLPGPPTLNPATVSGNTVSLSWIPGAGVSPTSYVLSVAATPGGGAIINAPVTGTSVTFASVSSGTYYLRVAAVNTGATGPVSNEIAVVVP